MLLTLYNQAVTSANTYTQSANTINGSVNNIINNQVDFLKTFKSLIFKLPQELGQFLLNNFFKY
jgi:hypothetical protein